MPGRRVWRVDAGLYALSAAVAGAVAIFSGIPLLREWGRLAVPVYLAGAVATLGVVGLISRGKDPSRALRWLAVAVLIGAALLPLRLEATWRARTSPGLHAQSEAIVTEEAARALKSGVDPYAAEYLHGPLEARPIGTKTHYPYLPAMLVFGLPRAFDGSNALADARVAFAAGTLALAAIALRRPPARRLPPSHRRIVALTLVALPTGALLMTTGGDDVPVLAFMLLALFLAEEGRPGAAGAAAGLAAITKQTAWILLPFLALVVRDSTGRPARGRFSLVAASIVAAGTIPFLVWSPRDFVEDVIRFPLGLGHQRSAAETPTLGSALIRMFPSSRTALTVALVCVFLAAFAYVILSRTPVTSSGAARNAGLLFLTGIVLAPSARFGYVVYPVNLLVWAWALRAVPARARAGVAALPGGDPDASGGGGQSEDPTGFRVRGGISGVDAHADRADAGASPVEQRTHPGLEEAIPPPHVEGDGLTL
jgi:hypothetical protein